MSNNAVLSRGTESYTAGAAKFGSAGLAAGAVLAAPATADAFISSTGASGGTITTGTFEAWIKTGTAANKYAIGHFKWWALGTNSSGNFRAAVGQAVLDSTFKVNDGAWHHVALVFTGGNAYMYADGNQVATVASTTTGADSSTYGCIGGYGTSAVTSNDWTGSVDEVRFSNVARYTGATYTVPTAPWTTDANTVALYHLDGDGTDYSITPIASPTIGAITIASAGGTDTITYPAPVAGTNPVAGVALFASTASGSYSTTPTATNVGTGGGTFTAASPTTGPKFYVVRAYDNGTTPTYSGPTNEVASYGAAPAVNILPNDANLIYSPYTWDVTAVRAKTINPGAYLRATINGGPSSLYATFDLTGIVTPLPQVAWRVDGGSWQSAELASSIRLSTRTDVSWGKHTVELVMKSVALTANRWLTQQAAVVFTGFATTPGTCTTEAITQRALVGCVLGDSITEGIRALSREPVNLSGKDTDASDARTTFAFNLATALGAEVGVVGFGGQGWVTTGSGSVPVLPSTWNVLWGSGPARSFTAVAPDFVVINEGQNDGATDIQSVVVAMIQAILAVTPAKTLILVVRPFSGQQAANLQAAVTTVASGRVRYIDTTGWWSNTDASDAVHPYGYWGMNRGGQLLAAAVRAELAKGAMKRNVGGVAVAVSSYRH